MSELVVPIERIRAARETVSRAVHRTPLLASSGAWAAARASGISAADGRIWVKAEHLQRTGSFKARGMTWKVAELSGDARTRGIVTVSAGNAGQAYAWAGATAGVPVVVVMPEEAVASKVAACIGYGAEVVLRGRHVGDTFAEAERIRTSRGLTLVHPFDDPDVIAGHGSLGLEILEDLPDVDVVVVPVGGGGLISGVAAAVKETRPGVRVYGVEPTGSNAVSLALDAGVAVPIEPASVADGLGAPFAGAWTLSMCRRYLDGIILVDDSAILAGVAFAAERMKQVLEPAGAAALAAILFGRVPVRDGERVCVVASGGNVDIARLAGLVAGAPAFPRSDGTPSVTDRTDASTSDDARGALLPEPHDMSPSPPVFPSLTPPSPFASLTPRARPVVARALDVLLHAGPELRRASFYAGAIALGTLAPLVLLVAAIVLLGGDLGLEEVEALLGAAGGEVATAISVAMTVAVIGMVVLSIESSAMASALLAARLEGSPLGPRHALRRSRTVFWRLVRASLVVAVPLVVAQELLGGLFTRLLGPSVAPAVSLEALVVIVLGAPFAYVVTGVVLGDVGARTAVVRSIRLFRTRPRLALVVAVFAAVAGLLPLLALSAGLDLVARVFDVLGGVIPEGGGGDELRVLLVGLVAAALSFAIGTLIFTVQALAVAPQVVAFVALTHVAPGLQRARTGVESPGVRDDAVPGWRPASRGTPWFGWPMRIGIALAWLSLVVGLASLFGG